MNKTNQQKGLPILIKVLSLLNEYRPDKFPEIQEYELIAKNELYVWINNTYYKFDIDDDFSVLSWEIEGEANSTDKHTEILLTIINSFINNPSDIIDLNGMPFRLNRIDLVIEFVSRRKTKKLREILKLLGVNKKTIDSYLKEKKIKECVRKRKNHYRRKVNDIDNVRVISEFLKYKAAFNYQYQVDRVIVDFKQYKHIIDTAVDQKLISGTNDSTKPLVATKYLDRLFIDTDNYDIYEDYQFVQAKLKSFERSGYKQDKLKLWIEKQEPLELVRDFEEFKRILKIINKKNYLGEQINLKDIISDKYFLISKVLKDDQIVKHRQIIHTDESGQLIITPDDAHNLTIDTSIETFTQLVVKFRGNPHIPIVIANIPIRFQIEDFVKMYGRNLTSLDVRKLLRMFNCNPNTANSIVTNHKEYLLGSGSNPFRWK